MNHLTVNAALYLAGPYQSLQADAPCHFALSLSAGRSSEWQASDGEVRAAWLESLLPWQFAGACTALALYIVDTDGKTVALGTAPRLAGDGSADAMLPALRQTILDKLKSPELEPRLRFAWGGEAAEASVIAGTPAAPDLAPQASTATLPAIVLLHTLATLPPRLAQGLGTTLYFRCDAEQVKTIRTASTLIAVPDRLRDALQNDEFAIDQAPLATDGHFLCAATAADGPRVRTPGLSLATVQGAAIPDEMKTYWLPVRSAVDQHLSNIEQLVTELLHTVPTIQSVHAGQLIARRETGAWLRVKGEDAVPAQAERFLQLAQATAASMDAALESHGNAEGGELVARRAALLKAALEPGGPVRQRLYDALLAELGRQWDAVLAAIRAAPGFAGVTLASAPIVEQFLAQRFPLAEPDGNRAAGPGDAMPFCVGQTDTRLMHWNDGSAASGGTALELEQVAGVAVLVRRGGAASPWRLVTAGLPVVSELDAPFDGNPAHFPKDSWLAQMQPAPLTSAYVNHLLSADYSYDGSPMRTADPLHHVHDTALANEGAGANETGRAGQPPHAFTLVPFSLQGAGWIAPEVAIEGRAECKAPPLRYGDSYDVAACVIDKVGAMPALLSGPYPWQIDFARLAGLAPPTAASIRYLRRVLPGPLRLACIDPASKQRMRDWPAIDSGVALRGFEYLDAQTRTRSVAAPVLGDDASVPALLISADQDRLVASPSRTVQLIPPTIDEHTLLRWAMPAQGAANPELAVATLKTALTTIHQKRLDRMQADASAVSVIDATGMPHDPAITALWVTGSWVDRAGREHTSFGGGVVLRLDRIPADAYTLKDFPAIQFVASAGAVAELQLTSATVATLTLPPGSFAIVNVAPLIDSTIWSARFHGALQTHLMAQAPDHFVALNPNRLMVEHAVGELPGPADVYKALQLSRGERSVEVRMRGLTDGLPFIASFTLKRQRWIWRNRPLVDLDTATADAVPAGERWRLLASGLPLPAFSPLERERDSDVMRAYDDLAVLDHGLADRPDHGDNYPRGADGAPTDDALLLTDLLDGITGADYLRYGVTLRSRYAAIFKASARSAAEVTGAIPADRWRRLTMPYRGDSQRLRPPKVLAIVPMTQSFDAADSAAPPSGGSTPLLILLDDIWFREYGPGERLEVRLALEPADLGETVEAARPYRVGGLPDHYLADIPDPAQPYSGPSYYGKHLATEADDLTHPQLLNVFGPFGYSFDRSGNAALGNATAFIAYPPDAVKPHSAMFLRLARYLDLPSAGGRSILTAAQPVYTLPDARKLACSTAAGQPGLLTLKADGSIAADGVALCCDPGAHAAARANYFYCLLVSEVANDGGRGVQVELPRAMVFLDGKVIPERFTNPQHLTASTAGPYRGRVLELLLNGKDARRDDLLGTTDLLQFWRQLLPEAGDQPRAGTDASAMVRRVSLAFDVSVAASHG